MSKKEYSDYIGVCLSDSRLDQNLKIFEKGAKDLFLTCTAKKISSNEHFALYCLGVKVIMIWNYYFEVFSTKEAFEVTQNSSFIDSFDRETYKFTAKRSLPHLEYDFPDTLDVKLHPHQSISIPTTGYKQISEEEFDECLKIEEKELDDKKLYFQTFQSIGEIDEVHDNKELPVKSCPSILD